MSPEAENPLAAVLAEELARMPEAERARTERILRLVFTTIDALEQRVRDLEDQQKQRGASGI